MRIKLLNDNAKVPEYATAGAACFDLSAASIEYQHGLVIIDTGIAFEVPAGHVLMVYPRSGLSAKYRTRLVNSTGVIDSDYRGPVILMFQADWNWSPRVGERVAQGMVIPVSQMRFDVVDELSETDRGEGGFGSTGG